MHHSALEKETIKDGDLIGRYVFGYKKLLTIKEIAAQCNLPEDILSLSDFRIDSDVWDKICVPVYPFHHRFENEVCHTVMPLPSSAVKRFRLLR